MSLFFVDCEAPFGVGSPAVGDMTEFGAVLFDENLPSRDWHRFHGVGCDRETFMVFEDWVLHENLGRRAVFVSDNPAYDWQWVNFYFWKWLGRNPFGHSARRIGDFYAGLVGDFRRANEWKRLRVTKHDHNPVHDAMGNAEAFGRLLAGQR